MAMPSLSRLLVLSLLSTFQRRHHKPSIYRKIITFQSILDSIKDSEGTPNAHSAFPFSSGLVKEMTRSRLSLTYTPSS
ncbi:hypothetical protein B0O99DRAFT_635382 [Bisporella sp. PMI_857]|nr:hypothetical protein B0O99DRAFT_635382 [Bisporella sp. PMI_857]